MSRKRAKTKFDSDALKDRVRSLLDNRHRLLAPFPIPALDLYFSMYTTDEIRAIQLLMSSRKGDMFNMGARFSVVTTELFACRESCTITVTLDNEMPMPDDNPHIPWENVSKEQRQQIKEWAPIWFKYKKETEILMEKLKSVTKACSTPGQVVRVWGDLMGFFSEDDQRRLAVARARSQLPEEVLRFSFTGLDGKPTRAKTLRPEFEPAAFEQYSTIIAEALMLPVTAGFHTGQHDFSGRDFDHTAV